MHLLIRSKPGSLRTSTSFAISATIHGSILAWLMFSPGRPAKKLNLYQQEIQPYEKKLVWYNLRDRLPDVAPSSTHQDPRPPRASKKFDQEVVAGARDNNRPPQLIYQPAPEIESPKMLPLPNVVAVAPPPRPVRAFTPPAEKPSAHALTLPDAPSVTPAVEERKVPLANAVARPLRNFAPPPEKKKADPAALPDAPSVAQAVEARQVALANSVARPLRNFTPPAEKKKADRVALPDAPSVAQAVEARQVALANSVARPLRNFTPPPETKKAVETAAALPDAPGVAAVAPAVPNAGRGSPLALPDPKAPLRRFNPPPEARPGPSSSPRDLPSAPNLAAGASASGPSQATLAIVGLHPTKAPDFRKPDGSREAGFSGGPEPRKEGGDGGADGISVIVVPGLTARGGLKDAQPTLTAANADPLSRENLLAAARNAMAMPPPKPPEPTAARVTSSPDPRLDGRAVYTVAIQMPNVTSFSGSWVVWFAERRPVPGAPPPEVRAPVPLRKVDPKYVAEAAQDRIEGTVRLFAVIRWDGHVEGVSVLRHLDDRLDRSAQEALAKWTFEPALRNGTPMDVEAVFEIPFKLAPRSVR